MEVFSPGSVFSDGFDVSDVSDSSDDERAVIRDGNIVLVNTLVFVDYLKYRKALQEKNARKHVPPFRPEKWAWVSGWNSRVVTMEERGG